MNAKNIFTTFAILSSFCLLAPQSLAVTGWDGGGGDLDFNNPLNWQTDFLPGSGVPDGSAGISGVVGVSTSAGFFPTANTLGNFWLRNGTTLTISHDFSTGRNGIVAGAFAVGQIANSSTTVTQTAGTLRTGTLNIGNSGTTVGFGGPLPVYNLNGGSIEANALTLDNGTLNLASGTETTFTGSATVTQGTQAGTLNLVAGATLSIFGNATIDNPGVGAFTVGSGSTLTLGSDGDNHVFADGLTIASGGTLEPYQTLNGAANITGDVIFASGSTYDYGVNPGDGVDLEDTVNVIGNLDLEAFTLDLSVFGSALSKITDEYTLFQFTTLTSSGGALTEAALNGLVTYSYPAGTQLLAANNPTLTIVGGNSIVLSGFSAFAIPEPSSLALLLIGGLLLRRRLGRTKS